MSESKTGIKIGITIIIILFVLFGTVGGIKIVSSYINPLKKAYDNSDYENIKTVEQACRQMIASYESDCLVYNQYRDSASEEKQSWAEQAKMRANKTASEYNNHMLANSFVWADNVPDDIKDELVYIE